MRSATFFPFLKSRDSIEKYFTLVSLVFLASFLFAPSNKAGNNVYYALIFFPAVFVFPVLFYRRENLALRRPEALLWASLVIWMILQGCIVNDFRVQILKHIAYTTSFLMIAGRLISPHLFRAPVFARGQFWLLQCYFLTSVLVFWIQGSYSPGARVLFMLGRIGGQGGAIWLAAALVLVLPAWIREKRWTELAAGLLLSGVCLIFVMQTRSALVGLFGGLLLGCGLWAWSHYPRARVWMIASIAGALILGLLLCWGFPIVRQLFARADSSRIELWALLWKDLQNCGIWLGCGNEFRTARVLSSGEVIDHAHGLYQSFALKTGLISLLLFLALCFHVLKTAWKNHDAWGAYLLTSLIAQLFDGGGLIGNPDDYWPVILFPLALIMNRYLPQKNTEAKDS